MKSFSYEFVSFFLGVNMAFIKLTSPLILSADPTLPNHPATKQYVDDKASNIDAAGFSAGLLNVMRLPALTGDVTMEAGSGNLVLSVTGVAPGTYTKVTLNTSGRITNGSQLGADDMPNISFSKIATGLPTTVAGYGLSDIIGLAGGTVAGVLKSSATPSAALHLVTKSYVDAMIQPSGDSIATGDVVRKAADVTPTGFLRPNGGRVSKVTYAALYSVIGDRYNALLLNGIESPWTHQESLGMAGVTTGVIGSSSAPANVNIHFDQNTTFVTHNKLYVIGTENLGGYRSPRALYATINANGTLGNFVRDDNITFSGTNSFTESDVIQTFVYKNKIWFYAVSAGFRKLWRSSINADGTITNPTLYSNPVGLTAKTRPVIIKNRLYLVDFDYAGTTGPLELVFTSFDADGNIGAFTSYGQINVNALKGYVADAFVYKNKFIIIAGNDQVVVPGVPGSSTVFTAYYAAVNSDGTLGAWQAGPTLSNPALNFGYFQSKAITTSNGIFIPFTYNYTWFTEGSGESAFSFQAFSLKIATLNTDAAGVPISWTMSGVLGHTGASTVGLRAAAVPNRIYISINPFYAGGTSYFVDFNGGATSYKQYYDGSLSSIDPNEFFLPDFTSKETLNTKYYIKT